MVAAVLGLGLVDLTLAARYHGALCPIVQTRGTASRPASAARVSAMPAMTDARVPSPDMPGPTFRFGFLEFEDKPDVRGK
jgi:hypothetical protein